MMRYLRSVADEAGHRARRWVAAPVPPWPAVVLLACVVLLEDLWR